MARLNGVQKLLIAELKEIKDDIKQVRTTDIPNLKIDMGIMKNSMALSSKIYAGIGALLATTVSLVIARWMPH